MQSSEWVVTDNVMALQTEVERLRLENAKLKEVMKNPSKIVWYKVSDKGAMSMMGVRRMPITLYKHEWLALLDQADAIRKFLAENEEKLKQ